MLINSNKTGNTVSRVMEFSPQMYVLIILKFWKISLNYLLVFAKFLNYGLFLTNHPE